MDTNKMRELKALAEAATQSHGARRVEVDHNGVHVIGDGSWKILSAWHTPDGKGAHNAEFAAAASPATILALIAEIERLEAQVRLAGVAAEMTVHQEVGRAVTRELVLARERDQLKAENEDYKSGQERYEQIIEDLKAEIETLRNLKLPHYLKLSDEMRAAGDHAELRERENQCYSVPVLKAVFFEAAIQRWLDDQEEAIEVAMAKEANHG